MKHSIFYAIPASLIAIPLLVGLGCTQRVTQDDVADARQDAAEERHEAADARQEAANEIQEQKQEEAATRHEVQRPTNPSGESPAVREEQRETQEVRKDAMDRVREEEKESRQAEQNADQMETKLTAQRERDQYVDQTKATLSQIDKRIDELKAQRDSTEEQALKTRLDDRIEQLQKDRDAAQEALDELTSEEVLSWQAERDNVDRALTPLKRELANPQ
ncbi:MAG: sll1863 family stress response protein [Thermoguttaceae bacterium]